MADQQVSVERQIASRERANEIYQRVIQTVLGLSTAGFAFPFTFFSEAMKEKAASETFCLFVGWPAVVALVLFAVSIFLSILFFEFSGTWIKQIYLEPNVADDDPTIGRLNFTYYGAISAFGAGLLALAVFAFTFSTP